MVDRLALLDPRRNHSIDSLQFFRRRRDSSSALTADSFILLLGKIRIIILLLKPTTGNPLAAIAHIWRQTEFRTAFFFITGAGTVAFTAACAEKAPGIGMVTGLAYALDPFTGIPLFTGIECTAFFRQYSGL